MEFAHVRIDDKPPCGRLAFCLTEDLTGNGLPDVIVGGLGAERPLSLFGKTLKLRYLPAVGRVIRRLESNVFWYENPGWVRHDVVTSPDLSVGASLGDITGNGRNDMVVGQNLGNELYWFEQPADPTQPWPRYLITDDFHKYHDTQIADIDGDGRPEVIILSQLSETICYYDIPDDPTRSPWPTSHRHLIADGVDVEGVEVVDIDGDGRPELIAGGNVFISEQGSWRRETFAPGWRWTRVAVGDLNGDGTPEIVLAEGDRPYHDGKLGRLGVFDPVDQDETVLADDLHNPHTLQLADFTDTGVPDIFVAEMGLGTNHDSRHLLYRNDGHGDFHPELLSQGIPTHEAKVVDLNGDGRLDIVGKSYTPTHHVDAWIQQ